MTYDSGAPKKVLRSWPFALQKVFAESLGVLHLSHTDSPRAASEVRETLRLVRVTLPTESSSRFAPNFLRRSSARRVFREKTLTELFALFGEENPEP